ncbi:transporter substrate-binding domain-containing protein [Lactobacillaceae bacterium Melli_B4]
MKKIFKYITMLAIFMMTVTALAGCSNNNSSKSSLETIKKRGTLNVGMITSNPPYEFHVTKNGKDKLMGSDLMLVKKLAKAMNVKYKITSYDMNGLLPAVQAKKVDMLVTALSPTPEREKAAKFSNVYYKSINRLVVKKSEVAKYNKDPKMFNNATIAVVGSSTQQPMIQKLYPKAQIKTFTNVPDLALAVNNNKADAFSIDDPTTAMLLHQNPGLAATNFKHADSSAGAAIIMPKDVSKDLVNVVNKTIDQNKSQYAKWVVEQAKYVEK